MTHLPAAFWAESLKARRSKVSLLTAIAFAIFAPVTVVQDHGRRKCGG